MGNYAFFDFKGINNCLPCLKVYLEDSLLFRDVLLLNLFFGTWFCGVFGVTLAIARGAPQWYGLTKSRQHVAIISEPSSAIPN